MPKIEIYTKTYCPYCTNAKDLVKKKGFDYIEYNIETNLSERKAMLERAPGAKTVPQIFINDQLIGGYDQLAALEKTGELDSLLVKQ